MKRGIYLELSGSNKEIAKNKLLILYIVDKLTQADDAALSSVLAETRIMNYFIMKQTIEELHDDGMLLMTTVEGRTKRQLTSDGRKILALLEGMLASGVRKTLGKKLAKYKDGAVYKEIYADFVLKGDNEYSVTCGASENGFRIIEVTLTAGTREHAKVICENWKAHSASIYPELTDSLLKKRDVTADDNDID